MLRVPLFLVSFVLSFATMAEQVVAEGRWATADYAVNGVWRIVDVGGRLVVKLGEDFETKNGPDLHVLMSPRPFSELSNGNASTDALVVGRLETSDKSVLFKKMKGAQDFELPGGIDLKQFRSILIHCVKFSHLWAGAELPH